MLLRKRGCGALVKHRFQRVFLPLLAGMFTIVPITMWVSSLAMSSPTQQNIRQHSDTTSIDPGSNIWAAARAGDLTAIERHLASGAEVDIVDPEGGGAPLLWAAVTGKADAIDLLIGRGADVNAVSQDGGTALHAAAFLGHEKAVEVLIQNGAKVNATNNSGNTPLDTAVLDEGTTRYFASLLQLELNEDGLGRRKAAIAESLRQNGATAGLQPRVTDLLMQMPLFNHLWFLWFLWWLVVGYAVVSAIGAKLPKVGLPEWMVLSPARYLWLVPVTMIPQAFMGGGGESPIFGPDTSTGLLPIPHVFAYYAIFFGFGAIYFGFDDRSGRVGQRWWLSISIGLLVVFPLALNLLTGLSGSLEPGLEPWVLRILSIFLQAAFPWLMTFGLMGLFRRVCAVESPTMRYLSDSAYWLYLVHLPLIVAAQYLVRDWPIPAIAKFLLIVVVVTVFLLWTYQIMVRYTALGRFLNGPRTRLAVSDAVPSQ